MDDTYSALRFRPITTADRETIQRFTFSACRRGCEISFANLIAWRFLFNTQYAVYNDCLFLRMDFGGRLFYVPPIALLSDVETCCDEQNDVLPLPILVSAIDIMRRDAAVMGQPLTIWSVSSAMRQAIDAAAPGLFSTVTERERADYIYLRDRLATLPGKKLQSKRNKVNKFRKLYPDYEYREFTAEMIPDCVDLVKRWRTLSKSDAVESEAEDLSREERAITRVLRRWAVMDMRGGTIWVDSKLVAFTYGCPINNDTFDVCVEKADKRYEGSFAIINNEFAAHLPERFVYVNREEDIGDEGLRRVKTTYKPVMLWEKSVMTERCPLEDYGDAEKTRRQVKALWQAVFCDPEEFVNLYFSRVYNDNVNVCCYWKGNVVSALQALPYTMLYHGCELPSAYISGVATAEEHRHKGFASSLMHKTHMRLRREGYVFAVLIPASESLSRWYESMGYAFKIDCSVPPADPTSTPFEAFSAAERARNCILLHSADNYDVALESIALEGDAYDASAHEAKGMIRIIDAKKALEAYARLNEDVDMSIRVRGDGHIPTNNAYYVVCGGKVRATDEPLPVCRTVSIGELACMIFGDGNAQMSLMLN